MEGVTEMSKRTNKTRTLHSSTQSMRIQEVQLEPMFDLTAYEDGFMFVSASFGHDGNVYILLIDQIPARERGIAARTAAGRWDRTGADKC